MTRAARCRWLAPALVVLLLMPAVASAQEERRSHVGVIGGFAPQSKTNQQFKPIFDADRIDLRSRDAEIGLIVRGRELGGDWGVSYVQKAYKDGSIIESLSSECAGCILYGTRDTLRSVRVRGLSVHKFVPFATIKRRAQVGLTFGGGIGWAKGEVDRREFGQDFIPPNRFVQRETMSTVEAKDIFLDGAIDVIPIWKLELTGAAIVASGLKVRAGGGINFINYPQFSASVIYLFGSSR